MHFKKSPKIYAVCCLPGVIGRVVHEELGAGRVEGRGGRHGAGVQKNLGLVEGRGVRRHDCRRGREGVGRGREAWGRRQRGQKCQTGTPGLPSVGWFIRLFDVLRPQENQL